MTKPLDFKRIAFFLYWFQGGGIPRIMTNLAEEFRNQGFSVDFVVGKAQGKYLSNLTGGINIIELKSPRAVLCIPGLITYLKRHQPDIFITANTHLNLVGLFSHHFASIPGLIVISEHAAYEQAHENRRKKNPLLAFLITKLISRFYLWADQIVGVSQSVTQSLIDRFNFDDNRISTIWNPVLTDSFQHLLDQPVSHPWFVARKYPVVVSVGRLTRQKNFPLLIRALTEVNQHQPTRLVILGDGEDRAALENLRDELKLTSKVQFLGYVDNPYPYIREADLFVLASLWEGLPTVLIEALAAGAPVIAADCPGGTREIIEAAGAGRLVPVNDLPELTKAIREELSLRGESIQSKPDLTLFTAGKAAESYLALFNRLVQKAAEDG